LIINILEGKPAVFSLLVDNTPDGYHNTHRKKIFPGIADFYPKIYYKNHFAYLFFKNMAKENDNL